MVTEQRGRHGYSGLGFTTTSSIAKFRLFLSLSCEESNEVTRGSLTSREWRSWLNSASNRTAGDVAKRVRGGEKSGLARDRIMLFTADERATYVQCAYATYTPARARFCRDARDAFSNYHRSNCHTKEHPGKGWFDRLIRPLSSNGRRRNANAWDPLRNGTRAGRSRREGTRAPHAHTRTISNFAKLLATLR